MSSKAKRSTRAADPYSSVRPHLPIETPLRITQGTTAQNEYCCPAYKLPDRLLVVPAGGKHDEANADECREGKGCAGEAKQAERQAGKKEPDRARAQQRIEKQQGSNAVKRKRRALGHGE